MSYAISWVAIRGKSPDVICEELGLTRTGEYDAVPDSPIAGAELPGGWYLVWSNAASDLSLSSISKGAEAVEFWVEEHVMACLARGWKDGSELWSVEHFSDKGIMHLEARGELPSQFAELRDQLLKRQADAGKKPDVDYVIEIPVELARVITDFAYDRDIPGAADDDLPFEILEADEGSPVATFKRGGCLGLVFALSLAAAVCLVFLEFL